MRSEIRETVETPNGRFITGAQVHVVTPDGTQVSVYADRTGVTTLPQPLRTTNGRIDGWLEDGSYVFEIATPDGRTATQAVEQISADAIRAAAGGIKLRRGIDLNPALEPNTLFVRVNGQGAAVEYLIQTGDLISVVTTAPTTISDNEIQVLTDSEGNPTDLYFGASV